MSVNFARRVSFRTAPLLVALVAIVTMSAPAAYHVVRVGELRTQVASLGQELAQRLAHEAARRPLLWRYDSAKIAESIQVSRVARTIVYDERGDEILAVGQSDDALLWVMSPIRDGGEVWMAASLTPARSTAAWLLLPFFFIGLALAFALWWLPRRTLFDAERQIDALVTDLENLNETLESQVQDRVDDLEKTYMALAERDRKLRELSSRSVAMQEAERRSIARDLHDGAGQTLTAVRLQLQLLEPSERGARAMALLDEAIDEVRCALDDLAPAVLDEVGLLAALQRLCQTVSETSGLEVAFEGCEPGQPHAAVEATLYRVAQEALHNAVRHANAQRIEVSLRKHDDRLVLEIGDDGEGFESGEIPGRGLRSMEERTQLLDGRWTLHNGLGRGTRVVVELPA